MSAPRTNPLGVSQAPAIQSPPNAPKPEQFHSDPRVHYDRNVSKWQYEDENGAEFEWAEAAQLWIPIVSPFGQTRRSTIRLNNNLVPSSWVQVTDELLKAQQAAYAVQGVDEEVFPVSSV